MKVITRKANDAKRRRHLVPVLLAAAGLVCESSATRAQTEVLEEIIVTAQKREQNLQDVPVAVQAISQAQLERLNYRSFEEYARLIPTLDFDGTSTSGSQGMRLRGIAPNAGDPTVAFYVDETPLQDSARVGFPNPRIVDVERIEVLRGPQGNLYGASAMGGTIKLVTNRPDPRQFAARMSAEFGYTENGKESYEFQGVVNLPVVEDKVAIRASLFFDQEEGWVDHVSPFATSTVSVPVEDPRGAEFGNKDINDVSTRGIRIAASFAPTEWLSLVPSVFYQKIERDALPEIDEPFERGNPRQLRFEVEPHSDEFTLYNLLATASFGGGVITSSTSYFDRENRDAFDFTGFLKPIFGPFTPGDAGFIPPITNLRETRDFTQEVRFASDWNGPLDLLLGGFYTDQERPFQQSFIADGAVAAGVLPVELLFTQNAPNDREEKAVFGNVTYRLGKRFEIQAGARWFDIEQNNRRVAAGLFNGGFSDETFISDDSDINYAFTASVHLTQDHMIYVRAAEGFRAGFAFTAPPRTPACDASLSALGITPTGLPGTVDPDSLWNYELGAKTTWPNARLRANVAAFWIDFSDIQQAVPLPNCGFAFFDNVGKARSRGIELEISGAPIQGLDIELAVGYVDAELRADAPALGATAGEPLIGVPEWTVSVSPQYVFDVPFADSDLFVRGNYRYVSKRTTDFGTLATRPTEAGTLDDYQILDVRIGLLNEGWEVSLFINNVTNERAEYSTSTFRRTRAFSINQPRTVGIGINRSF